MDINFHYFAVKTLAVAAGFPEEEAQIIAQYSQYVDDFNWIDYIPCNNIPEYILDEFKDVVADEEMGIINPVTTGFESMWDYLYIYMERGQKFTCSAFHFIPNEKADNYVDIPTQPASLSPAKSSIITHLLSETKRSLETTSQRRKLYLLQLGMYLHIFADTYAHQGFSGYESEINKYRVTSLKNNLTGESFGDSTISKITNTYRCFSPAIGHARVGHYPDLTYMSFGMTNKDGMTTYRNNTDVFLNAAKQIFEFLVKCKPQESKERWANIKDRIYRVFLQEYVPANIPAMVANWEKEFKSDEYLYHYSKSDIEKGFFINEEERRFNYTREFYWYNLAASKVLIKLYGEMPRSA